MANTDSQQRSAPDYVPPEDGIRLRIKARREELGLNVEELARLTAEYDYAQLEPGEKPKSKGISPSMLRRYEYDSESGGSKPGARELCLLCYALDVSADWLLLGEKPSDDKSPMIRAAEAFVEAVIAIEKDRQHPFSGRDRAWKQVERADKLQKAKLPGGPQSER